jgi:hypothetical protein
LLGFSLETWPPTSLPGVLLKLDLNSEGHRFISSLVDLKARAELEILCRI